jgi:hypothetical protein
VQREAEFSNLGDLLRYSLTTWSRWRVRRGFRHLLDEKWRTVYQANAPHGLFGHRELRAA